MIYLHDISDHAVRRYGERIRSGAERSDLMECLQAADPKDLKKAMRKKKRTAMVRTGCCVFVFSTGTAVTVLTHDQLRKVPAAHQVAHP